MDAQKCRKTILVVWLIGTGALFVLLFIQSIFEHYGNDVTDAWGWFTTSIMPTLSLVLGVTIAEHGQPQLPKQVDRFSYLLVFWISILYLAVALVTLLLEPISPLGPIGLLKRSNLWLGPLQGIVTASFGILFVRTNPTRGSASASTPTVSG